MPQEIDWWTRQFVELLKELTRTYQKFLETRKIDYLDISEKLREDLNEAYSLSLSLLDYFEIGRALLESVGPLPKQ